MQVNLENFSKEALEQIINKKYNIELIKKGIKNINMAYIDNNGCWHGMGSMSGVTAWMPLPEPYAEGDEK